MHPVPAVQGPRFPRSSLTFALLCTVSAIAPTVHADEAQLRAEIAELRAQIAEMKAQMKTIVEQVAEHADGGDIDDAE